MKFFSLLLILTLLLLTLAKPGLAAELVLVDQRQAKVPIFLADDASEETRTAANNLAEYIEKIAGSRPPILTTIPDPLPSNAIWVGMHPALPKAMPSINFTFNHPEEILIACDGRHVAVLGRDRFAGGKQTEFGTVHAVTRFLQNYLQVRWLWPGELGEDVIPQDTLTLPVFEYRHHPLFRQRLMYRGQYTAALNKIVDRWYTFQHLKLDSYNYTGGHAYTDWWDKYHQSHPDYFAMLPDGKREPARNAKDVKLCVSNPAVAQQWLDNAGEKISQDPTLTTISASPNDGGGFCVCDNCRAMDHPDGQKIMGYVSLTDRYVKYWNTLAKGLRERYPDQAVDVGAYAYSAYRNPPVAEKLEPNIAVGYVGHFPLAGSQTREKERESFAIWAKSASRIIFRPNLFHYTGGWYAMPSVALTQTIDDFKFLADNHCVGISVDSLPQAFATQGLQTYLMAQLTYDPHQDGQAILKDYYHRGFGPAADDVKAYFDVLQEAHDKLLEVVLYSSARAKESVLQCGEVYNPQVMAKATAHLDAATAKVKDMPGKYPARVAFLRAGCDYVTLQSQIIPLMTRVRESHGKDTQAVKEAIELCAQREKLVKDHYDDFAIKLGNWYFKSRKIDDFNGPPSEEFRKAAGIE